MYKTRLLAKKFIFGKLFWRALYSTLREELQVEENIWFSREINENLVIKEDLEIEIVEEINENPIIEKDIEIKIVETRKEEIEVKIVNELGVIKSNQCKSQTPIILVGGTKLSFDSIVDSYLVNFANCMKTKKKESQVAQLMTFKFGKKIEDEVFKVFVWLAWKILDLEYQLKASFFQVMGSNVGQNLQLYFCYLLLLFIFNFYVIFRNLVLGLKVCLEFAYFVQIEIFLLKVL